MRISATYINRSDLSGMTKWRYSVEERIEHNERVRALCRRYLLLPTGIQDAMVGISALLSIVPLVLMWICERAINIILGEEDTAACGVLVLFVLLLGVAVYYHPIGWLLVALTVQCLTTLWFVNLMKDYEEQL